MIVRFYSLSENPEKVTLKLYGSPESAALVNTLEKEVGTLEVKNGEITVTAPPFTVNAVKIKF